MHFIFEALTVVNSITLSVLIVRYVKFTRFVQIQHKNIHEKIDAKTIKGHIAEVCTVCKKLVVRFDPITKVCAHCQRKADS